MRTTTKRVLIGAGGALAVLAAGWGAAVLVFHVVSNRTQRKLDEARVQRQAATINERRPGLGEFALITRAHGLGWPVDGDEFKFGEDELGPYLLFNVADGVARLRLRKDGSDTIYVANFSGNAEYRNALYADNIAYETFAIEASSPTTG